MTTNLPSMSVRPTKLSMVVSALIQLVLSAVIGGFLSTSVLVFNTGKTPPESDSLAVLTYGAVIAVVLYTLLNIRYSRKQKAAYVAAGGNKNTSIFSFMFGDMGGEVTTDGMWQQTSPNPN